MHAHQNYQQNAARAVYIREGDVEHVREASWHLEEMEGSKVWAALEELRSGGAQNAVDQDRQQVAGPLSEDSVTP